jgi:hypothetical protein
MNRFAKRNGVLRAVDGVAPETSALKPGDQLMGAGHVDPGSMLGSFQPMAMPQLRDGGEIHAADGVSPWSIKGMVNKYNEMTAPSEKDKAIAQYRADNTKDAMLRHDAPAPVVQPAAPTTVNNIAANIQGVSAETNAKKYGFKHGGTLRTGMGGDVPGTGTGDKIPAKYEPGEFVVSNDMLAAEPALRGQLRGLREEVLADKGMTPEQADAKALGGNRLQAVDGVIVGDVSGNNKLPTYQVPAVANGAPAQLPTNPGVRDPYRYLGQRAGEFLRSPMVEQANRGVSALAAGYNAHNTMNDIEAGNTAGAIDNGALTAASALSASTTPAGWLGAAYGAGHAVGKHVVNPMLSDDTKNSIGRTINSGVRKVGGALGRDWGVDDTALRQLDKVPLTPGVNAGAPKPQLRDTQNFDADNNAMLAKFAAENPDLNAKNLPKAGDTSNTDAFGKLMPDGTQRLFDGQAWTHVSTPEGKAQRAAEAAEWKQEQLDNAARHTAMIDRQYKYFEDLRGGGEDKYANMPIKMATALRSADIAAQAQLQANAESNATSRANTQSTNETSLMGHKMTNRFNLNNMLREQANKDREFSAGRDDKASEQRLSHDKAWSDHAATIFQADDGNGKMVPDAKRIAAYTQATDATVGAMAKQLLGSSNPKEVAYGKKLMTHGKAALDERDRANMTKHFQRMELHRDSYGMNPLAGSGGPTNDLRTYSDANMRPQQGNLIQQRMEFVDPNTGLPVGSIPNVNLQYGPNASHVFPNFSAPNNSLR